jgi:hypothetical protein
MCQTTWLSPCLRPCQRPEAGEVVPRGRRTVPESLESEEEIVNELLLPALLTMVEQRFLQISKPLRKNMVVVMVAFYGC